MVVDKSLRGTPQVRPVGGNPISLTHDLAWWVKQPLMEPVATGGLREKLSSAGLPNVNPEEPRP